MIGVIEALAAIIGGRHAVTTAASLLEEASGLRGLTDLGGPALRWLGVPRKGAERLAAAFALLHHAVEPQASRRRISGPEDVASLLRGKYGRLETERFGAILLDARNGVIQVLEAAQGGVSSVMTPPANIYRMAVRVGCANLIAFHNHPSGSAAPSVEDIEMTKRLIAAGGLLGIRVLDHVVVTSAAFTSIREDRPALFLESAPLARVAGAER